MSYDTTEVQFVAPKTQAEARDPSAAHGTTPMRAAIASLIGNTIEWYDFYIYGTAAALVFNVVFFPSYNEALGTLLAFGTLAVGAFMRPLGGLICGHFGDRVGRKSMLVATLVVMGLITFAIGLLPGYATIGVAAPIILLLLRSLQGIAFGGEWAGAALVAVEHAPPRRRGILGSFTQMGSPIALFLSTGTFSILNSLPREQFIAWGWRIPFLASILLVVVGLVFRLKLPETPTFTAVKNSGKIARAPLIEVLRDHTKPVILATGIALCTVVAFYIQAVYVVSYAIQNLGVPRQTILNAVLVTAGFQLVALPIYATIADRIGFKPVAMFGAVMVALTAFPFFWLVDGATFIGMTAGLCLGMVGIAALFSVLPSYLSTLFEPRLRYSGLSIAYGLAAGVIAGLSPLLCSALFSLTQSTISISLYLMLVAVISAVCVGLTPKNADQAS